VVTERVPEPDGRHWFGFEAPEDGTGDTALNRLVVGSADGSTVFSSAVTWPGWLPLDAAWDSAGRIWVSSGDTGVAVFVPADGSWRRYAWEPGATADRAPLLDVTTNETVAWLDATPPADLRIRGSHA
jgi:hypothetical protein